MEEVSSLYLVFTLSFYFFFFFFFCLFRFSTHSETWTSPSLGKCQNVQATTNGKYKITEVGTFALGSVQRSLREKKSWMRYERKQVPKTA